MPVVSSGPLDKVLKLGCHPHSGTKALLFSLQDMVCFQMSRGVAESAQPFCVLKLWGHRLQRTGEGVSSELTLFFFCTLPEQPPLEKRCCFSFLQSLHLIG